MSYLSTIDFTEDPAFVDRFQRTMKGDLDLSWMDLPRERVRCRPLAQGRVGHQHFQTKRFDALHEQLVILLVTRPSIL